MTYYQSTFCCTAKEFINVSSEATYKNMLRRNKINRVRRGCRGNEALIEFNSLPEKYQQRILGLNNTTIVFNEEKNFANEILLDFDAVVAFNLCEVNGSQLKRNIQVLLTNEASILNALKKRYRNHSLRFSTPKGNANFWKNTANTLQDIHSEWQHRLPKKPYELREVFFNYCEKGYESLMKLD